MARRGRGGWEEAEGADNRGRMEEVTVQEGGEKGRKEEER